MPGQHRLAYLDKATQVVHSYLTSTSISTVDAPIAQLTLLVPQLNPALDVYDRRFLLQLTWAVARGAAEAKLRTRVLIQGRRKFGAVPLSVAGLRRDFDADLVLSALDWPTVLRSGELEEEDDVDEEDDVFVVVSPTNAVSIPVINAVIDLVHRAQGRPVILVNPRLEDVPSHSGVMQVSGRRDRLRFLDSIQRLLYFRLLYSPGARYPPRGILFRGFPTAWQVWRAIDVDTDYTLILEQDTRPSSAQISAAFKKDAFQRRNAHADMPRDGEENPSANSVTSLDGFLNSYVLLALLVIAGLLAALYFSLPDPMFMLHLVLPTP